MGKQENFSDKVLSFNDELANTVLVLPGDYCIKNPFNSDHKEKIRKITHSFYKKYYNDHQKRRLILGSSPARRGTAVTGIPFLDAGYLYKITGIKIDGFYINKSSSDFLYEVIEEYGCEKFYKNFFMSFVCPFGIVKTNTNGKETNCNYYENKKVEDTLYEFIINSLKKQISFGIDTSVCYCIGSGDNFRFLMKINEQYHFFDRIIPLEHPRFIMQYHSKDKDEYLNKYLVALRKEKSK